jgi:SAM-dependent methyltransferase
MDPKAMTPYGLALLAFLQGDAQANLIIRRDDGVEGSLPVSHFFRQPGQFTTIEDTALGLSHGQVLDIGAGAGIHSLVLQSRGLRVTAIDLSPQAVEIMVRRGVVDVQCGDIFSFQGGLFDTLLMLGHGIGLVENRQGLERFLQQVGGLLRPGGQLLLDSLDVRRTQDPSHLAYQEANRRAGRYPGEIRMQFAYNGQAGPYCGWLHVDAQTLGEQARQRGWGCEVVIEEESGDYLARLTRMRAAWTDT